MEKKFEILAPAGSFETLKAVVNAGADAVYLGGRQFGARAFANNFSDEELMRAIDYCHLRGVKLYLTVNTLMKNLEIQKELIEYLTPFYEQGLDAVIVQDMGVFSILHDNFPDMDLHASTQMTIHGVEGAKLMKELGASRVVTSRELSLEEIKKIRQEVDIEIETFVHGALCYSYSGQCLFSSMLGGRSGNRGRCAQPCRLPYAVLDQNGKVISEESYILSLKDNCAIDLLKEMDCAGVYSLKIEGRMKQAEYAAGVVSFYRKYVDSYLSNDDTIKVSVKDQEALLNLGNRCGFTNRFFTDHNGTDMITRTKPSHEKGDQTLQNNIRQAYMESENLLPLKGKVKALLNQRLEVSYSWGEIMVHLEGDEVSAAQKRPVEKADIEKAFGRIGDEDFKVIDLEIEMDSSIFLPINTMKSLRRQALQQLKNQLLDQYRREFSCFTTEKKIEPLKTKMDKEFICAVEQREQFDLALNCKSLDTIYIDVQMYERANLLTCLPEDIKRIHLSKKKAGFIMPVIFRDNSASYFRGHLEELRDLNLDYLIVRNYEELFFAKEFLNNFIIVADHNLYTYNNIAENFMREAGAQITTVPLELNQKEISHRQNAFSEMIVYGNYPLMITASCVTKNTTGCKHESSMRMLLDRYQKKFPVRNYCNDCVNVIYNSLPTCLIDSLSTIENMGIHRYRIQFTTEKANQVKEVLMAISGENTLGFETTKGHFKRGVE